MLTKTFKISDKTKADFSNLIYLEYMVKQDDSNVILISAVFLTR